MLECGTSDLLAKLCTQLMILDGVLDHSNVQKRNSVTDQSNNVSYASSAYRSSGNFPIEDLCS